MLSPKEEKIITPGLVLKYISGKATADERITVAAAIDKYPAVKKIVETVYKYYTPVPFSNPCIVVELRPAVLPVFNLAAISEFNDCVVKCEHYVLELHGKRSEYRKLYKEAISRNWLKTEKDGGKTVGTPLYNIGRLSELASLSVARLFDGTLEGLKNELDAGCSIIAAINAKRLKRKRSKGCDHAVVVLDISVEEDYVEIYDPESGNATDRYPVRTFLSAWKTSRNFFVSVIKRGVRPYTPHPVNVSRVRLPEEFDSLKHMLAENAHEIWAACRIISRKLRTFFQESPEEAFGKEQILCALHYEAGVWRGLAEETLEDMVDNKELKKVNGSYRLKTKGNKAKIEEDVSNDPFMRPFWNLPEDDRKTDYTSSVNTLKLLYKMGYRLEKEKGMDVRYCPNQMTADGQYIPRPMDLDDVELPDEIKELTEYIAENAHEEWAKQRMKEGWIFAEKTNRTLKRSYDLVPYCELLDSEKKYDRRMAMNTVRLLYKMGYRLVKEKKEQKTSK